jgi:hypothetical protein
MKTPQKSLGQIAYEVHAPISPTNTPWWKLTETFQRRYERIARAVEREVLRRREERNRKAIRELK